MSYVNSRSYLVYGDDSDLVMFGLNYIGFKTKLDVENLLLKIPGVKIPVKNQENQQGLKQSDNTIPWEEAMKILEKKVEISKKNNVAPKKKVQTILSLTSQSNDTPNFEGFMAEQYTRAAIAKANKQDMHSFTF
jgi:hypothetical protein